MRSMTAASFRAGISTVTSERFRSACSSSGSRHSLVLQGRHGTRINATQSKEPATTRKSIHAIPNACYSFGFASSGSLCSELRSPQRIKTPLSDTTKKARQNPNQMFRQRIGQIEHRRKHGGNEEEQSGQRGRLPFFSSRYDLA